MGPAQLKSRAATARPGPQKSWAVTARPGPAEISGRSCSILFPSVFLKDFSMKLWTLLITHLKLSIVLSKKWRILAKSSRNIRKKRPGPARPSWNSGPTGPARPSPPKFVRPDLSSLGFTTLLSRTNFSREDLFSDVFQNFWF